jgi:hypothetical protein
MIKTFRALTLLRVARPAIARPFNSDTFKDRGNSAENEWARRENGKLS